MNAKPMLALTAALWLGIGLSGCSDNDEDAEGTNGGSEQTQNADAADTQDTSTSDAEAEDAESKAEEPTSAIDPAERQQVLEDSLRGNFDPQLGEIRYLVGWADLNDDGQDEAIVHVVGPMVCGTGGCDTLILQAQGDTYQVLSAQPTTEPPIALGADNHDGWQDLLMQRHVAADQPSETVRLRFDGDSYVEADGKGDDATGGKTLIEPFDSLDDAHPLFEGEISGSYEMSEPSAEASSSSDKDDKQKEKDSSIQEDSDPEAAGDAVEEEAEQQQDDSSPQQ
ncbi:hypothetical protein [Halomonas binhaiensis]|uniref:Lipoprotein n=1 Tax=Halomonas binhaiensis TaxID=2562282 RepID=A0A5C1NE83_9GAMM|nr:hypothetical protein [Halomonas binhaiensis]QEM81281.1 hypothetical protein E4T21_06835 [Halomonas binhaiensis]